MADTEDKNAAKREGVVSFMLNLLSYVIAWVNKAFNAIVGIKPDLNPTMDKVRRDAPAFSEILVFNWSHDSWSIHLDRMTIKQPLSQMWKASSQKLRLA